MRSHRNIHINPQRAVRFGKYKDRPAFFIITPSHNWPANRAIPWNIQSSPIRPDGRYTETALLTAIKPRGTLISWEQMS